MSSSNTTPPTSSPLLPAAPTGKGFSNTRQRCFEHRGAEETRRPAEGPGPPRHPLGGARPRPASAPPGRGPQGRSAGEAAGTAGARRGGAPGSGGRAARTVAHCTAPRRAPARTHRPPQAPRRTRPQHGSAGPA